MRVILILFAVLMSAATLSACGGPPRPDAVTTVYLVRHAEKQAIGDDPSLTETGYARAERLAGLLKTQNVVQVWSTDTLRTVETAEPTADAFGLDIQLYEPEHLYRVADRVKTPEGVVLVVGHSNTIPALAAALAGLGETYPDFADNDYESLFVAEITADGQTLVRKSSHKALQKQLK